MTLYVLDASALLALFLQEDGHSRVAEVLEDSAISSVNLCEVGSRISDRGFDLLRFYAKVQQLPVKVISFDVVQSEMASRLRTATRAAGLSLGDRACLALAEHMRAAALTSDRAWAALSVDIQVELIR